MKEVDRLARNEKILAELYPKFARRIRGVLGLMEDRYARRPRLQDGWRDPRVQASLVTAGLSQVRWSFHSATGDAGKPEALAVHVYDDNEKNPADPSKRFLIELAICARAVDVNSGILFGLPHPFKNALVAAIVAEQTTFSGKIGWDPCHLEVAGIGLGEAKTGRRPT